MNLLYKAMEEKELKLKLKLKEESKEDVVWL